MFQQVSVLVLAVGMAVSVAFREAFVNLFVDPPLVVCDGNWIVGCERVPGGVEILATDAPDMTFSFEGLTTEVILGYQVVSVDDGEFLFCGEGCNVPLSLCSGAVSISFYALTGEVNWAELTSISASESSPLMALAADKRRLSAQGAMEDSGPAGFQKLLSGGTFTASLAGNCGHGYDFAGATVLPGSVVTGELYSVPKAFAATYQGHHGALSITVEGMTTLNGTYDLQVGADDTVSLTIGDVGASLAGESPFRYGEEITFSGSGLSPVSLTYSSVGGPAQYEIKIDAPLDLSHYGLVPYGVLTVSPAKLQLGWSTNAIPVTVSLQCAEEGGSLGSVSGRGISGTQTGGYALDPMQFFGEMNKVEVLVTAQERYQDSHPQNNVVQTHNHFASIEVTPPTTNLSISKNNLTVTNGFTNDVIKAKGCDAPTLRYVLIPGPHLSVTDMNIRAGNDILQWMEFCKEKNLSIDEIYDTFVDWVAYFGQKPVASGRHPITLKVELSTKTSSCSACCSEGTTVNVDLSCVSFRQRFGRTPLLAGMPEGALMIEEENLSDALFTPAVLRYDHPMERRLNPITRVVTEPNGRSLMYDNQGQPCGADIAADSCLIQQANGVFQERFADRSIVEYDAEGNVTAFISSQGVRVSRADLGIEVIRDDNDVITQIVSAADGVIDVLVDTPTSYRVIWTDTTGVVFKTLNFSQEGEQTLCLIDNENYPTRWTWNDELHDFVMARGDANEAITVERSVAYVGTQAMVSKRYLKNGVVASEETEVIDAVNGNAVVERTTGGRAMLSATRVTEGYGIGKIAATVDALGAETAYTYDEYGRTLTQVTCGATTNVVEYVYATDRYDRRPWSTIETEDGELIREETFSDVMLLNGERIETTTTCGLATIKQFYAADSVNRYEAGKLKALLRPNGRMTWYDYSYDAAQGMLLVMQTEGVADENLNFTLIEGKSTRTQTTYDVRGNAVRVEREAWVEEAWRPLTWETRTYSAAHKHLGSVYSNGLSKDSRWNCTGPLWEIDTDTIATTNSYNTLKQMVSSTRYGSFGALTTTYEYDAAGNVIRTQRGDLVSTRTYDLSGRLTAETDEQGRTTTYAYPNEQTTIVTSPSGATRITTRDSLGRMVSVTGTAVTPEYHTYGPNWQKLNYGSPNGARWVKTFTDGLGRTVRTETAGANNSVIVSENTYNDKGQLIRTETTGEAPVVYTYNAWGEVVTTQRGERVPQERSSAYVLIDGEVWLEEVSKVGDLIQTSRTDAEGFTQVATDVRGNETVTTLEIEGAEQTTITMLPGVTNPRVSVTLDGVTVSETDMAGVTQTMDYDVYRRVIAQTDGRNNTTTRVYDAFGRLASVTDAAGATTSYVYDNVGNVASVTNALGNVVTYAYDVRGNKIYEGGATYPVAYEYDTFGRKVKMTTFREEAENAEGDVTTWMYDEATGGLLAKTYADGVGVTYTLTDDGKTATRTDARGKVTTYTYNDYGELVSQDYSDDTTDIAMVYDNLGRVTQVTDAAGVTTLTYNQYGELETEANLRTLMRHYDDYGRGAGWSLNGSRKNVIQYDNATGRLYRMQAGGAWFTWSYLPGTNLKSQLTYGGSGNTTWEYEPNRDLLTRVKNTIYGAVASQYDYTNDIGGRRTQIGKSGTMMAQNEVQDYGYNTRDELISGQGLTYNYDDIGNRTMAEGKVYTANELNQYTAIDTFEPQYDADGNQTRIKTSTGIWSVTYNAENRPVRWVKDNIVITMNFDRMGRRVFYKEEADGVVTKHHKFVYDNYLCVQKLDALNNNAQINLFVWDPTEPVATRPLFTQRGTGYKFFYTCDGNKNVSELVHFETRNGIAAHYDYAPFGAVTRAISASVITDNTFTTDNPFRFSSEYHDDTLGLVYYNYRHYNPIDGRWMNRDLIEEVFPYLQCKNSPIGLLDIHGLWVFSIGINLTGSVFGGGTISFGIAISYSKEVGAEVAAYISPGFGASSGMPGGSCSVQVQYSHSAPTTTGLSGGACVVGGSIGGGLSVGIEESFPINAEEGYKFTVVSIGLGTPKVEGHVFCTKTTIWKYKLSDCTIEEGESKSVQMIKVPPGFYLGVM